MKKFELLLQKERKGRESENSQDRKIGWCDERNGRKEDEGRETFRSPFGPAPPTHLPKPAPVFLSVNFQDTS